MSLPVIGGNVGAIGAVKDGERGVAGYTQGEAAVIDLNRADSPSPQEAILLREGQFVQSVEFDYVGLIEGSDGFFKLAVALIFGKAGIGVVAIGVGEDFGEGIAGVEREAVRIAARKFEDERVIVRVAALIAAALAGVDVQVLRKGAQRLRDGLREAGIRNLEAGCNCRG